MRDKTPGGTKKVLGFAKARCGTARFRERSCIIQIMRGRFVPGFWVLLVLFFTSAGGAFAEPPSPNADTQHLCVAQAEGFLSARLGRWQQRLNLADWKISVVMARASGLKPNTLGNIHWDGKQRTAVIRVLDASDYQVSCHEALPDMEMTLVHELVHLELSSLPRSADSRREEEFAVNRIADALVRLDRQDGRTAALYSKPDTPRSRADAPAPTW